jgi:hypothetical protein
MKKTVVLSLAALACAISSAQAGCPRGQILRVSKNVCVDRDEAIKLGIMHGVPSGGGKAKPAKADTPQEAEKPEAAPSDIAAPEPLKTVAPAPTPVKTEYVPPAHPAQPAADMETSRPPVSAVRRVGAAPREPLPVKAEAPAGKANPFGALDPGGVPMSQPR